MNLILMTVGESLDKAFYGFDIAIFKLFAAIQCTFLTYVAKFFMADTPDCRFPRILGCGVV